MLKSSRARVYCLWGSRTPPLSDCLRNLIVIDPSGHAIRTWRCGVVGTETYHLFPWEGSTPSGLNIMSGLPFFALVLYGTVAQWKTWSNCCSCQWVRIPLVPLFANHAPVYEKNQLRYTDLAQCVMDPPTTCHDGLLSIVFWLTLMHWFDSSGGDSSNPAGAVPA